MGSIEALKKRIMSGILDDQGQVKTLDQWQGEFGVVCPNLLSSVCANEELNMNLLNTTLNEFFALEVIFYTFSKETVYCPHFAIEFNGK